MNWFQRSFEKTSASIGDGLGEKIAGIRKNGFEQFLEEGFPTTKDERWKYTNLGSFSKLSFEIAEKGNTPPITEKFETSSIVSARVSVVNGLIDADNSQFASEADSFVVAPLSEVISGQHGEAVRSRVADKFSATLPEEANSIVAANSALFNDAVVIFVADGRNIHDPIEVLSLNVAGDSSAIVTAPRLFVDVGNGANASVLERVSSEGSKEVLSLEVAEINVGSKATYSHTVLREGGENTAQLGVISSEQGAESKVDFFDFCLTSGLVRSEAYPVLKGEDCVASLFGLNLGEASEHFDNYTVVHHTEPNCVSNQLYKGVYAGESRGAFSGTIVVDSIAQKTNAFQSSASVLLSDSSRVDTRPQLKIWADDVKCSHGATVGQLDENALFYLRSRGISKSAAKAMLVEAFAEEVVSAIEDEALRDEVSSLVAKRLHEMCARL